jgi:TonB family protein
VISLLFLSGTDFAQLGPGKPITPIEITALVATGTGAGRLVSLVKNRGVGFIPDEAFLKALQADGVEDSLLAVLKSPDVYRNGLPVPDPATALKDSQALALLHQAAQVNRNNFHHEKAEPLFRAAVAADPANPFVHLALGEILPHGADDAIAEYRTALNLQPDLAEAHLWLGEALPLSQRQEALEHLEQAVRLAPADGLSHFYYGQMLELNGEKEAGAEQRKKAAALQTSPPVFRLHVGGSAMGPKLISHHLPKYPPEVKIAHIMGMVRMDVLVAGDGTVKDVELISGNPALTGPAMEAIWTWRYRPTLLNGLPVEVVTEIDVNFK